MINYHYSKVDYYNIIIVLIDIYDSLLYLSLNMKFMKNIKAKTNSLNNLQGYLFTYKNENSIIKSYKNENENTIKRSPNLFLEQELNLAEIKQKLSSKYDVVIIGAGHNGLVCANYLARAGKKVLILEKRHLVGGCAVTEELFKGYKFSRCSYVLSLFRKNIIDDIYKDSFYKEIKLYKRNPKSFTPSLKDDSYFVRRHEKNLLNEHIAKLSKNDVNGVSNLDNFLTQMVKIIDPLIDMEPPQKIDFFNPNFRKMAFHMIKNAKSLFQFYHFITSSSEYYLNKYLENDLIKGTYATDAVVGAMKSPKTPGSAYVLLHHCMGDLDQDGNWFYVEGGNGSITNYLAKECKKRGVVISLNTPVSKILYDESTRKINGVKVTLDDEEIYLSTSTLVSNCDLNNTFFKLMNKTDREKLLNENDIKGLEQIDYTSPVMKINLAVNKLPQFKCLKHLFSSEKEYNEKIGPNYLTGTIHLNSDSIDIIDKAYVDASKGLVSENPIIEMTIPSILDKTLVPKDSNHHVIGLFCQYFPSKLNSGEWTEDKKKECAKRIYNEIEKYCPGFIDSILFEDILSPKDLEKEFSITEGNICHSSMELSSIFFCRPFLGFSSNKHSVNGLYSCSAAMHPGGGVMGVAGRNCANSILKNNKI